MKPYKLLTEDIAVKGKGKVTNVTTRLIGPADSIFSLFMRSYGARNIVPMGDREIYIYDKNPKHIKMFQLMLEWDGVVDQSVYTYGPSSPEPNFDSFIDHVNKSAEIAGIEVNDFFCNKTLGRLCRTGITNFTFHWEHFRKSKFHYLHLDVVDNTKEFVDALLEMSIDVKTQFVKLDFSYTDYSVYKEKVNAILHVLWLRSIKTFDSIVEILDENGNSYEEYAGKMYAKLNPTFCILPWMHIQYKPSGQAKPCCRYDTIRERSEWEEQERTKIPNLNLSDLYVERSTYHLIQQNTMEQSFSSSYWDKARQLTLENKPISGCHKCYKEEDTSEDVAVSMRLGSAILYNDGYLHKKPRFEKPIIEFLEVGFGNYCNMACLTCNSSLSTTWYDDEMQLNEIAGEPLQRMVFPKLDNIRFEPNDETLSTLRLIKFTGGEPMINPEFIKFIELICEKGTPENISLEIYTNCSYIPSPKLLENLTRFKDIQLNLSVDAYGSTNDYIRYGSTWSSDTKQNVSQSLNFWLDCGLKHENFHIIMSTTLSILNVFEIPKLMEWWFETYRQSGNKVVIRVGPKPRGEYDGFFKLQLAFDPSYISLDVLPAEYYTELLEWCESFEQKFLETYNQYEAVPECLNASVIKLRNTVKRAKGNKKNAQLLLDYLSKMDSIRNNSGTAAVPYMISKVKQYLLTQDTQT